MLKKQPLQRLIMLGFTLATASLHVQSSPELVQPELLTALSLVAALSLLTALS